MKQTLCYLVLLLLTGVALAHTTSTSQTQQLIQQGQVVPAAVAEQLKQVPITQIGSQKVRRVPIAALAGKRANNSTDSTTTEASTNAGGTLVARASDNLVGISTNELVIISSNLDAIVAKVATLQLAGAEIHAYPKLKLLVVKTAQFDQLETIHNSVAASFPDAKFDLPVTYFPRRRH
ncbi:MAG: hypothetical protein ABI351_13045 [Herbaspirillum sp.]